MAMEITNNYSSYTAQSIAGNAKKKETEKAQETMGRSKSKSTAEYANELVKLVPSVEFRVGNACVSDKSGKSLTVNSQLLEKMQNDPKKEKNMKDMIKGVESMSKLAESIAKASGWTIVYQHSYIDENGKYHCRMQSKNDFMLNMSAKLREERKKNSERLLERTKEKVQEESVYSRAEQFLEEKIAASKDGTIYLNDTDMKIIIEAAQEEDASKTIVKNQPQVGANLDLKI
ncbi:MAG: hypothetical protein HFI37_07565 [Lachnospiraceae bacterium]|nr:hypothetical protein [Lachnospiraceae bacterium]